MQGIGEFGVCVEDAGAGKLRYLIAGTYRGGDVPEGTVLYELPEGTWAVFDCNGPIPDALQALTNRVFGDWLPGNPEFEMDGAASVEWYDPDNDFASSELHTQLWIPVKPKGEKTVTDRPHSGLHSVSGADCAATAGRAIHIAERNHARSPGEDLLRDVGLYHL